MWEIAPFWSFFEKEVIPHSNNKRLHASESTHFNLSNKSVFLFHVLLELRWPIESKFSQICYFMHYVGTHQVRILVFVVYQRGPVPVTKQSTCYLDIFILEGHCHLELSWYDVAEFALGIPPLLTKISWCCLDNFNYNRLIVRTNEHLDPIILFWNLSLLRIDLFLGMMSP